MEAFHSRVCLRFEFSILLLKRAEAMLLVVCAPPQLRICIFKISNTLTETSRGGSVLPSPEEPHRLQLDVLGIVSSRRQRDETGGRWKPLYGFTIRASPTLRALPHRRWSNLLGGCGHHTVVRHFINRVVFVVVGELNRGPKEIKKAL